MLSGRPSQTRRSAVTEETITLTMSRSDAEVLLGVLAAERHNPEADAVCQTLRVRLDQELSEAGG
jgi:hypothetical protein